MSKTKNIAYIIGNVAKTPELNETPSGNKVCSFQVITNTTYKKGDESLEESKAHTCVAWGRLAEICSELLQTGTLVHVEGRLSDHDFTDKDGVQRTITEIICNEMIVLRQPERKE